MRLSEISPYLDTGVIVKRPQPRVKRIPPGKTSGIVDSMAGQLEDIVDNWIRVDWNDVEDVTKERFSNAVTELLDIINREDI